MKKRQFTLLSLTILMSAFVVLYGCKKDEEVKEFDTQSAQDNSLAEATFNDALEIANQAIANGSTGLSTYRLQHPQGTFLSNCASVTLSPDSSGQGGTIVVDFGASSCLCDDGRYRKGAINVDFTATYRDSGAVISASFTNYFVGIDSSNMFQVTGNKTVTNKGHNSAGNLWFTIDVNGQLQNRNGAIMSWTSQRQREWLEGESTSGLNLQAWIDDVYAITGTASGTTFEGKSYTANIINPLIVDLGCRWIKAGIFELTPAGLATRTLNYGSGACDQFATVTVNGATFDIRLR